LRTKDNNENGGFSRNGAWPGGDGPVGGRAERPLNGSGGNAARLRSRVLVLALVAAVLLLLGIRFFHYIPDDSYITLRYARNVMEGEGFVFNEGQRLEGYTNFLWILMLVCAGKLGASLPLAARTLSFFFSCAVLVTAGYGAWANRTGRENGWTQALAIAAAPILLAASPSFLTWSLSGTEIPLFTFLLLLGVVLLLDGRRPESAFTVFGILGLVRPEGLLFYALAGSILIDGSRNKAKMLLTGAAIFALIYAPYLVWKQAYFGELLPNTFYAKRAPAALAIKNGAHYLLGFTTRYGYFLVIGLLMLWKRTGVNRRAIIPLFFIAAHWLFILLFGGDWMPHYRLLLPTLPLVTLLVSFGLMAIGRSAVDRPEDTCAAVDRPEDAPGDADDAPGAAGNTSVNDKNKWSNPVPVVVTILVVLAMAPGGIGYDSFITERLAVKTFETLGRHLGETLPPGTRIALGSTGAVGYYSRLHIIDILGLTERSIARSGRIVATQPGHMKADGRHVLRRKPDLLLLGNIQIHQGQRGESEMVIKVQERDILLQPGFTKRFEFVNLPLGRGFFLSCYKRRDFMPPP